MSHTSVIVKNSIFLLIISLTSKTNYNHNFNQLVQSIAEKRIFDAQPKSDLFLQTTVTTPLNYLSKQLTSTSAMDESLNANIYNWL